MTTALVATSTARGRRAGIVSRVTAGAVDLVVVEVGFALVLVGIAFARFLLTSEPFELGDPPVWVTGATQYLALTGYLAWGWATTGRTLGKAVVGLRVVTDRGAPLRPATAIVRAGLCAAVGPLLVMWAIVSPRNAGIHDILLSTAVVYDWQPRHRQPARV